MQPSEALDELILYITCRDVLDSRQPVYGSQLGLMDISNTGLAADVFDRSGTLLYFDFCDHGGFGHEISPCAACRDVADVTR